MSIKLKIKDLPVNERPYEKLEKYGPEMLSDAELLAIIIKSGNKNETSVSLAQRVLAQDEGGKGLISLHDFSLEQLRLVNGIGRVKAIQIKAVMELSKRVASTFSNNGKIVIKSSYDVSKLLMEEMRHLKKEVFKTLLLNTKNHLIKQINVSVGSLNASIVHPREVFSEAVKSGCSAVIFIHNHPSGDPEPSMEDIETTRKLLSAGDVLGIKVLDHIIIGDGVYISLKEKGFI
ncbi:MAG TPA: DNA repair protein RadC [Clostridiales bacterium]|nr:DNA repair protein RadC [Clostridiales bacterium]